MKYSIKFCLFLILCLSLCSCSSSKIQDNITIVRDGSIEDSVNYEDNLNYEDNIDTSNEPEEAFNTTTNEVEDTSTENDSDEVVSSTISMNSEVQEENKNFLSRNELIDIIIKYIKCGNNNDLENFKFSHCTKDCKIDLLFNKNCTNVVVSICAEECKDTPSSYMIYFSSDYENGDDIDYKTGVLLVDVLNMRINSIKVVNFE